MKNIKIFGIASHSHRFKFFLYFIKTLKFSLKTKCLKYSRICVTKLSI